MPIAPINFGIQSNPGRYGHDGTGKLVNCYAEAKGGEGKNPVAIYAAHGLKLFANTSTDNITRGLLPIGDVLYWVVGKELRRVDSVGTDTLIAGIADSGKVLMARNSKVDTPQIAMATQGGLRFVLEDDELTPIADSDLPPPIAVEYQGGYILYLLPDGRVFYSEINDAANISSLNFLEAEARPDGGKAIIVIGNIIWVFGEKTVQPFQNTGGTNNPFTPLLGSTVERGCLAGGTVKLLDNAAVWVADDRTVRRMSGSVPQKVSTPYVDELLRNETDHENLTGDVYSMQGHEFYVLSGTSFTVVYDASTGLWHDRKSSLLDRWRGQCIVKFGEKWIVGDNTNGNLYEIDADTYGENGDDMTMVLESPLVHNSPNRLQYNALWLDFVTGRGLNSTDDHNADPQVTLQYSDDGGFTWSNARTRSLGLIGAYGKRAKFNRLGTEKYKGRVYRLEVSAQVVRGFIMAHADIQSVAA